MVTNKSVQDKASVGKGSVMMPPCSINLFPEVNTWTIISMGQQIATNSFTNLEQNI